jgi:hypothetical protein
MAETESQVAIICYLNRQRAGSGRAGHMAVKCVLGAMGCRRWG